MAQNGTTHLNLSRAGSRQALVPNAQLKSASKSQIWATSAASGPAGPGRRGSESANCRCAGSKFVAVGSIAAPERAQSHNGRYPTEASEGVQSNAVNGAGLSTSKNGAHLNGAANGSHEANRDRAAVNGFHVEWSQDAEDATPSPANEEPEASANSNGSTAARQEKVLDEKELLRRQRISGKNKGRIPWNTGKKHSPETIRKIREGTRKAMLNPETQRKLKRKPPPHTEEVKERVRQKLKQFYAMRRAAVDQLVQTESLATLKAADAAFEAFQDLPPQTPLAELATPADGGEADGGLIAPLRLLQPSSVEHLTEIGLLARIRRVVSSAVGTLERQNARQVKQNEAKLRRAAARTAKKLAAQEARQLEKAQSVRAPSQPHDAERKAKISEAIRQKWQDPEYRAKMGATTRVRRSGAPRQRPTAGRERRKVQRQEAEASEEASKRQAAQKTRRPRTTRKVARPVVSKEDGKAAPSSKRKQKLAVAQQLVDELESMLSNFSDQDMDDENSGVRQSVEEAQALVEKAKACVQRLSGPNPTPGIRSTNGVELDELESALLVLDRDRS